MIGTILVLKYPIGDSKGKVVSAGTLFTVTNFTYSHIDLKCSSNDEIYKVRQENLFLNFKKYEICIVIDL
jgi:hypothetical protein